LKIIGATLLERRTAFSSNHCDLVIEGYEQLLVHSIWPGSEGAIFSTWRVLAPFIAKGRLNLWLNSTLRHFPIWPRATAKTSSSGQSGRAARSFEHIKR
jgi:hypothetical protein